MTTGTEDAVAHARCLATEQCTDGEIAAALVVEKGWAFLTAREFVAGIADDLVTARHYGRSLMRRRHSALAAGKDLGKVTGAHVAAMESYGRAYLNLDEHQKVAKLIEAGERKMAKRPPKLGVAS